MSGEEDEKEYELKDLIVQTLEANGVLPKIKAQIRANVFMALDQSDKKMNNSHSNIENVAAKKVLSINEGRLSAALVRDFLEKTNLEYTLGVFDPELNPKTVLDHREKLLEHFKISDKGADAPVLIDLIKKVNSSPSTERHDTNEISQSLIDAIKAKFDYLDLSRKGVIDQEKARELFKDLFPHFSKGVIDAFLSDEFTTSEIIKGVDYPKFLSVFKKWYSQCQITHNTAEKEIKSNAQQPKLNQTSKIDVHKDLFDDLVKSNKDDLKKTNNVSNGLSSLGDLPPLTGVSNQNKKSLNTLNKDLEKRFKDTEDDNYDDDFTSGTTPRTPNQERKGSVKTPRGGPVSDEEIEENLSYVEESSKIDEITVDKSISTIQNNDADYIEDLSI